MSNFNYNCPIIWHFCSESNTRKIESIQFRALKFIYDDYQSSYEDLLARSKLPSLKVRRLRTIALETFKILHKQCPEFLHDLVNLKSSNYNFRHLNSAEVPRTNTTRYGLHSFRYLELPIRGSKIPNLANPI